ncbi:uncharacterized protein LOC130777664 isoform X2 [Actinidia eriantha]|uniref:uncharacterized protein LOC130777664 isoform X2 n=1 Tax=Actinidia eriantha TaxID=165200 RepID=UPI002589803A|nr:uncharacterized protein LOC130777664 isoform X2 [Actinidia eriantha]
MSEASRDLGASAEPNKVGPDCFAFYTHEVAELLSQDDDFLPLSSETSELVGRTSGVGGDRAISRHNYSGKDKIVLGSLFCNPTGARLSDIKKERLKALLRQSVIALSQEVDEMLDPVLGIHQILSHLKYRKSLSNYSGVACEGDAEQHPQKKIKLSTSISIPPHASPASSVSAEVNDDLQFLLENDAVKLGYMEQLLEVILDTVVSNCRSMTLTEKQQLQRLIQKLPPRNLDRVVEIIRRDTPFERYSSDEIYVDLEKEDNTTLWRLYYYVEAIENARKLPGLLNLSKPYNHLKFRNGFLQCACSLHLVFQNGNKFLCYLNSSR